MAICYFLLRPPFSQLSSLIVLYELALCQLASSDLPGCSPAPLGWRPQKRCGKQRAESLWINDGEVHETANRERLAGPSPSRLWLNLIRLLRRPVLACKPNIVSNLLIDFFYCPARLLWRVALGIFQHEYISEQYAVARRVTFGDPREIANETVLAVPVFSYAVGRFTDRPFEIDWQQVWRAALTPAPLLVALFETARPLIRWLRATRGTSSREGIGHRGHASSNLKEQMPRCANVSFANATRQPLWRLSLKRH
jgi:hypothetical protein